MGLARDERVQALIDVGLAISESLDLERILPRLVRAACDLTGARYGALGVVDESGSRLDRFITEGVSDEARARIGDLPSGHGILGAVIVDPRPLRLSNLGDDPHSVGFPEHHPSMRTFLGVPVLAGGEVFGNLYLTEKADGGEFTDEDEQAAVLLAAQAGIAIHNARLFAESARHAEALERALSELASVDELIGALLNGASRDQVLDLLAQRALGNLPCAVIGVALASSDRRQLRYVAAAGDTADRLRGHEVPVAGSKIGAALLARRVVRIDDIEADPDAHRATAQAAGVRSLVIVPLVRQLEAVGVIVACSHDPGAELSHDDERLLRAFATRAILILELSRALAAERDRADAIGRLVASETRNATRKQALPGDSSRHALMSILTRLRQLEQDPRLDTDARAAVGDLWETTQNAIRDEPPIVAEPHNAAEPG